MRMYSHRQKISLAEEHNASEDRNRSGFFFFFFPLLYWDMILLLREKACYLWCLKIMPGQRCLSNQFHLSPHTRRGDLQLFRAPAAEALPDCQSELSRSQPRFLSANGEDLLCRWGRELGPSVVLNRNSKSLGGGTECRDLQALPVTAVIHRDGLCSAPWLTAAPALLQQPLPAPSATATAPHAALQSRLLHGALSLLPPRLWQSTDARWQDKLNSWSCGSWMMERAGKTQ